MVLPWRRSTTRAHLNKQPRTGKTPSKTRTGHQDLHRSQHRKAALTHAPSRQPTHPIDPPHKAGHPWTTFQTHSQRADERPDQTVNTDNHTNTPAEPPTPPHPKSPERTKWQVRPHRHSLKTPKPASKHQLPPPRPPHHLSCAHAHPHHVPQLPGQRNTRGYLRPQHLRPSTDPTHLPRLPRHRPPHPTRHHPP